jgi:hypothetical protein
VLSQRLQRHNCADTLKQMIISKGKMDERTVDSIIARERKGNDMYGVICNVPDDKLFI